MLSVTHKNRSEFMKNKILIGVLLALFLLPQITQAAWWNPFTWKIFNKTIEVTTPQTQSYSPASSTNEANIKFVPSSTSSQPINTTKKETKSTSSALAKPTPTLENFDTLALTEIEKRIQQNRKMVDWLDTIIYRVDSHLERMKRTRDSSQASISSFDTVESYMPLLINLYNEDIETIQSYKAIFVGSKARLETNTSGYLVKAESLRGGLVSREQFIRLLEELSQDRVSQNQFDYVQKHYTDFVAYQEKSDAQYEHVFTLLKEKYGRITTPNPPSYQAPTLPPIRIPQMTSTSCNVWGTTITCNSSSY